MVIQTNHRKAKYYCVSRHKILVKFILVLITIATAFRWVSSTTTSLSLTSSSFIQSSEKGNKIVKIFDKKQTRHQEETESSSSTDASTVLLLHYHKTGNNFIADLLTEIDKTHKQKRHDLAMKDPFVLDREFKRTYNNINEGADDDESETSNMRDQHARREYTNKIDDGDEKKRPRQKSKKGSIDGYSDKVQTKKANGSNRMSSNAAAVDVNNKTSTPPGGLLKRDNKKRNKGEDARIQQEAKKAHAKEMPQKRSHDPLTGCPIMGGSMEFAIGAAYRLTAPDLFCNLSLPVKVNKTIIVGLDDHSESLLPHDMEAEVAVELDDMKTQKDHRIIASSTTRLPFPAWETTKIVHFVRDPFDMALSNYLYHSQHPTPEPWVLARHLNPCATDHELINRTLAILTSDGSNYKSRDPSTFPKAANITNDDLLQVTELCQYYRRDHPMGGYRPNMTRAFYALLRKLPPYDGLRVATAQFLLAQNPQSGGDLLRMPNNILRLGEWEANGALLLMGSQEEESTRKKKQQRHHSHILTVSMGKIVKDMKGSIQEICNFMFGHLSNDTVRSEIAQDIADAMVSMYNAKQQASEEIRIEKAKRANEGKKPVPKEVMNNTIANSTWREGSHVTQGLLNSTGRRLLKKQLEKDPVLGKIMLQLRELVNSAGSGM